jgi:hypothetical protein
MDGVPAKQKWPGRVAVWVALAVFPVLCLITLGVGIHFTMQTWKVRHWEAVLCRISRAELKVPAEIRHSGEVRPSIDYEFQWKGEPVTVRDTAWHFTDLDKRDGRVGEMEEVLALIRAWPQRWCRVNPADPQQSEIAERSYAEALVFLITGGVGFLICLCVILCTVRPERNFLPPRLRRVLGIMGNLAAILLCAAIGTLFILTPHGRYSKEAETQFIKVPCSMVVSTARTRFAPDVLFRYEWNRRQWHSNNLDFKKNYTGWSAQDVVDRYPAGSSQHCWIDPERPWVAALERNFDAAWKAWVIGGFFFTIPIVALVLWVRRGFRFDCPANPEPSPAPSEVPPRQDRMSS